MSVLRGLDLPARRRPSPSGIGVAADGSLRVGWGDSLLGVGRDVRQIAWRTGVSAGPEVSGIRSAPCVLSDGSSVVLTCESIAWIDARGNSLRTAATDCELDDSGPAPIVRPDGSVLVTSPTGAIVVLDATGVARVGSFGVDLLPPGVAPDGTLSLAATEAAMSVAPDWTIRWCDESLSADILPSVHSSGDSAFASMSEGIVRLYGRDGDALGEVDDFGPLGAIGASDWVLLGRRATRRTDRLGNVIWRLPCTQPDSPLGWGALGPVILDDEALLVPCEAGILLVSGADGRRVGMVEVDGPIMDIAPVGDGRAVVLAGARLLLVGEDPGDGDEAGRREGMTASGG